ncbi:EAL domain-containing protein [Pseudalkalibacillus berkeleyi]|uniref:EAL domain-containing protein n=1 Tax=Pseudalkalibacillus berkeleyi TaxID=1069813 RepID=A0ABS9GYL9_9BACL|nr:EAL domain-containing protein [Pseudalkalibacillus berkeleyi]MCF6136785.1 EAL domain-containing protein [Pseudalkalibacillus berkeleyi]
MKTYTTMYRNKAQILEFIERNELSNKENLFIQIFTKDGKVKVTRLHEILVDALPQAVLIGATVDASFSKEIKTAGTVVSITVFNKVKVKSTFVQFNPGMDTYQEALNMGQNTINDDTKAIVLFGSSHTIDNQVVLDAFANHYPDLLVAGGNAVPLGTNNLEYLIATDGIIDCGMVVVSLSGVDLQASLHACTEWNTAGRSFMVTGANEDLIQTLDHKPVKEIYQKYLGREMLENIKQAGSSFPLMVKQGAVTKPILIKDFHQDGSITVAEPIEVGTTVYIGCGDASIFLNTFNFISDKLRGVPVEGLFMYSCMSRIRFFKKGVEHEMNTIKNLVPTTGAFTAGEYYHEDGKNEMLSYALTFLSLAESEVYIDETDFNRAANTNSEIKEILALSQLIKASTEDLEELYNSLRESEQRYTSLFEHNPDIVYSVDSHGKITSINASLEKILGYTCKEVIGNKATDFLREEDVERVYHYFHLAMRDKPQHFTLVIRHKNGENVLFEIANMPIRVNDEVVGVYGVAKNRTEQFLAEQKISELAYHDSLTGLPNRLSFHERLNEKIEIAHENNESVAVMVIDLDEFKMINDSLGHHAGDRILKHVATNLSGCISDRDFIARFAADEFLILVPTVESVNELSALADQLLTAIKKPVFLKGKEYVLSGSIGVSLYPSDALDEEKLLKNANLALHKAKRSGRNSIQFFTGDMNAMISERLELENHLRKALSLNELEVYYQPQIDIESGRVFAFEALLRWKHTKRGMIPPNIFIPIAEDTGVINEIGYWVLLEACTQTRQWHESGMNDLSVCVNVSGIQFQRPDFIDEVKACLETSGLESSFLHIELTESIMLEDVEHTIKIINQLKGLGVKISVDDFGTGYSSLSYLRDFPIDILKIDQSFIRNLEDSNPDAAIVRAIITMCEGLNVTVLAEGVETEQQLKTLQQFGCNQIQGYYISKPVKAVEIKGLYKNFQMN